MKHHNKSLHWILLRFAPQKPVSSNVRDHNKLNMEPDFQISVKGLPEDIALNVGSTIAEIIKAFKKNGNLDFRRMHSIVVASDFAGELAELSTKIASGNKITHTNEDYAVAVAKVMIIPNGDEFEIRPILSAQYAAALVPEGSEGYDADNFYYILHLLHHELCHVHDDNKKIDVFHELMLKHHYKGKDMFIRPLSEICWSEYIANVLSSKTATDTNLKDIVISFEDAVKRTKSDIDSEILLYRYHADLEKLLDIFKRNGEFLVKMAAYTMGYMDGLGVMLEELSLEASEIISGSYFQSTWEAMHEALKEMRSVYPEGWKDLSIYNKLSNVLENYYDKMGLILSTTEDGGTYVDIPFRAETTPNL